MMVLRASQKDALLEEVNEKLGEETRKVHMNTRPTVNILAEILSVAPNIEVISCPPSLYGRTNRKIKKALEMVGVRFRSRHLTPGRPRSHPRWKVRRIHTLRERGYSPAEISENLDIPLTTVYYYMKKD